MIDGTYVGWIEGDRRRIAYIIEGRMTDLVELVELDGLAYPGEPDWGSDSLDCLWTARIILWHALGDLRQVNLIDVLFAGEVVRCFQSDWILPVSRLEVWIDHASAGLALAHRGFPPDCPSCG